MNYMFMPFKRYADFSGRSRRQEFWMWTLFQFLLGVAFVVAFMIIGGAAAFAGAGGSPEGLLAAGGGIFILAMIWFLLWLVMLIPNLAVTVRRLHDSNRSGKWLAAYIGIYILYWVGTVGMAVGTASPDGQPSGATIAFSLVLSLLLLAGAVTILVFMFLDGTPGPNRYGEDPKGRGAVDAQVFA